MRIRCAALAVLVVLATAIGALLLAVPGSAGATDGPAGAPAHEAAGRWGCAGLQPVAGVCVDNPVPALPPVVRL